MKAIAVFIKLVAHQVKKAQTQPLQRMTWSACYEQLHIICRYVTKLDTHNKFRIEMSGTNEQDMHNQHFKAHSIGSTEVVYNVLGLQHQT
jgi:hypothetical protein